MEEACAVSNCSKQLSRRYAFLLCVVRIQARTINIVRFSEGVGLDFSEVKRTAFFEVVVGARNDEGRGWPRRCFFGAEDMQLIMCKLQVVFRPETIESALVSDYLHAEGYILIDIGS